MNYNEIIECLNAEIQLQGIDVSYKIELTDEGLAIESNEIELIIELLDNISDSLKIVRT